ncbi:hypothetical protein C8Q72DRAFT_865730 [Fomitopsis betulina]|nr:hypothetical protein C8Q72DRAFT_865730 [Fomitopsis betulina]
MDYLRSLVPKAGPFTTTSRVSAYDGRSLWTLYDATSRDDDDGGGAARDSEAR